MSGFNAWGQLQFQAPERHVEPDDLCEFTCVLTGDAINRPRPSMSHTSGRFLALQFNIISSACCQCRSALLQATRLCGRKFDRQSSPACLSSLLCNDCLLVRLQ